MEEIKEVEKIESVVNDVEDAIDDADEKVSKPLSVDEIRSLGDYLELESSKKNLSDKVKQMHEASDDLKKSFSNIGEIDNIIDTKLSEYETVEDLAKALSTDQQVKDFYTDENGKEIGINIQFDSDRKKIEFMRESLILFKTMEISNKNIDIEFERLDAATKELDDSIKDACYQLSDNVLTYTGYLRDKAVLCEDKALAKKILTNVKYIESGYNLDIYNEILDKHPSITKNTLAELFDYYNGKSSKIANTGKRYINHIIKNKVATSLTMYISSDDVAKESEAGIVNTDKKSMSFEENFLTSDDFKYKDLFIYSLIRFFSMANWDDSNIKMAHSSICLVIGKMYNHTLDDQLQKELLEKIKEYIKRY